MLRTVLELASFLWVVYRFALPHGTDRLGRPIIAALKASQNHQVFQINFNKRHCGLCWGQEIRRWQARFTEQQPWGCLWEPGAVSRFCVQPRMLIRTWHPAPKLLACAAFHSHMGFTPRMQTHILGMGGKTPQRLRRSATLSHTPSSQKHSWRGR